MTDRIHRRVGHVGFAALAALALALACREGATGDEPLEPPSVMDVFGVPNPTAEIPVRLETTEGVVRCTLDPVGAPRAVASFVGLATGRAAFRDGATGRTVKRAFYDGLTVFRAVPSVLVQSGCPRGDGTGYPGYRFAVETRPGDAARLASPGALVLARYTSPPGRTDPDPPARGAVHGSQFAITLGDMRHLAGTSTVLGSCVDLDVVRRIAEARLGGHLPVLTRVIVETR